MALIKFDRRRLLYGDIKPEKVVPIKYQAYEKNAKGATVVDLNKSAVDRQRKLLSLYTSKTSQIKFNQVVDIEFQDFPVQETDNSILLLQNRLNALLSEKNTLLSARDLDKAKIDELNAIIEELRKQLQDAINEFTKFKVINTPDITENEVPNSLSLGGYLGSDRLGRPGDPGYPQIENILLSKNRKARLIIQSDGNCVITKGEYDIKGNPIAPDEVVDAFGWDNGKSAPNFFFFYRAWSPTSTQAAVLAVGGVVPVWRDNWRTPVFDNVSNRAKVVLEDSATLSIYDGDRIIWSSFGIDLNADVYDLRKQREAEELKKITNANARAQAEATKKRQEELARLEIQRRRRVEEARVAANREQFLRAKLIQASRSEFTKLQFIKDLQSNPSLKAEFDSLLVKYPELNNSETQNIFNRI